MYSEMRAETREPVDDRAMNQSVARTLVIIVGVVAWQPLPAVVVGLGLLLVGTGIVLPAVWSARPERRRAAVVVLRLLFVARGRRDPAIKP